MERRFFAVFSQDRDSSRDSTYQFLTEDDACIFATQNFKNDHISMPQVVTEKYNDETKKWEIYKIIELSEGKWVRTF